MCARRLAALEQVTEDFLEEYGWKRLYREIGELGKSETVMTTQSHELRENARVVRERLERNRCAPPREPEPTGRPSAANTARGCAADPWSAVGSETSNRSARMTGLTGSACGHSQHRESIIVRRRTRGSAGGARLGQPPLRITT